MVWSYIGLGKIWTHRSAGTALIEYHCAIKSNETTRAALDEAQQLLRRPYELP